MIKEAIESLSQGHDLSAPQMGAVMEEIMAGQIDTSQIISFLAALNKKGPTAQELTAAVAIMRLHVTVITTCREVVLDTCGTGGDAKGTFNISTVVAFVASGCGVYVAKHGNRSVSSHCGSADVLEHLGINIAMDPEKLEECLEAIGITFLFAPNLHPAMKFAMPARRQMGVRTIFNIIGPLSNPAGATHQLVGVYAKEWTEIVATVLRNLGTKRALVVYGDDGLDEITTTGKTFVSEVNHGILRSYEIAPDDFGFKKAALSDLQGGTVDENAHIALSILKGSLGPKRDIVVLNAAAALYAAQKAASIKEGIAAAEHAIDSKKALEKLLLLKKFSQK